MRTIVKPWFAVPAVLFLVALFVLPIGSFLGRALFDPEPTLRHLERLWDSRAFEIVTWNTFRLAGLVTLACLLLGYPLALRIATLRPALAAAILLVLVLSVWISLLVRNYAWMVLLGRDGLISKGLLWLGLTDQPRSLLYNEGSVIIAMTHILLPYMVIPLVAALRALDPSQLRAAMILGARPRRVLRRVVWPLSLPGLAAGTVIVFVMALGFYVTPALMGGRGQITLAMLLDTEINEQLNWGYAAAHALVLLLATLAILVVYNRRFGLARLWGGIQ